MQAAVQMCVKATRNGVAAVGTFLDGHSAALRHALNFDGLLLSPVPPGGDICGATLWWCVRIMPPFLPQRFLTAIVHTYSCTTSAWRHSLFWGRSALHGYAISSLM